MIKEFEKKYGSLDEKIYKSGSQTGDMKIPVTGGAGFIRRGIVKRLCGTKAFYKIRMRIEA